MENQIKDLLQFVSERFPSARFEIVHNSLSTTLKHFIIRDDSGDKGFGTDHNYDLAVEKAYSEFVERKTFQELHRTFGLFHTSNGFAAHIDFKNSKQSSVYELIERDALLLTWHSKTAPYWLTESEARALILSENLEINYNHKKYGLKLNLGIVAKHRNVFTCVAKVEGKNCFYIDTKTGKNIKTILNALIESISFYSHYINLGHNNNGQSNNPTQPIDHFYYYLNHSSNTKWFHKGSSNVIEISPCRINTYSINPEDILGIENLNRVVSFSESNLMQSYYCGSFDWENINLKRFHQIFGKNVKYNKQIHPLS